MRSIAAIVFGLAVCAYAAAGCSGPRDASRHSSRSQPAGAPATEEPMGRVRRLRPSTSLGSPPAIDAAAVYLTPASYASFSSEWNTIRTARSSKPRRRT